MRGLSDSLIDEFGETSRDLEPRRDVVRSTRTPSTRQRTYGLRPTPSGVAAMDIAIGSRSVIWAGSPMRRELQSRNSSRERLSASGQLDRTRSILE
jgi:hypothetical protein